MLTAHLVCVVLACICFLLAFLNRPISNPPALSIGWLGMLLLTVGYLIGPR